MTMRISFRRLMLHEKRESTAVATVENARYKQHAMTSRTSGSDRDYEDIQFERDGDIAWITINREDRGNQFRALVNALTAK